MSKAAAPRAALVWPPPAAKESTLLSDPTGLLEVRLRARAAAADAAAHFAPPHSVPHRERDDRAHAGERDAARAHPRRVGAHG